jgi:hypothetical protein
LSTDTKKLLLAFEAKSYSQVSGTATCIENKVKVTFEAKLTGLQPGVHAIHIHEKSDCSAADGSSAGGHWNPDSVARAVHHCVGLGRWDYFVPRFLQLAWHRVERRIYQVVPLCFVLC